MGVDFEDAVIRLETARNEIESLDGEVASFNNTHPHRIEVEFDAKTGVHTLILRVLRQPPNAWRSVLESIVQHMRSPLDYLVVAIADANGGHGRRSAFPIYTRQEDFLRATNPKTRGCKTANIPPLALALIESVQPYQGGNYERLGLLRELNDDGKHKRLAAVTSVSLRPRLGIRKNEGMLVILQMYGSPLEDGDPLAVIRSEGENEIHPTGTPQVVFGKASAAAGKPLVPTLLELHETTTGVVTQFLETFG